jgi:hypothetical protein
LDAHTLWVHFASPHCLSRIYILNFVYHQLSIQSSAASSVHLFWIFSVNDNIITRTHNPKRQERRRIFLLLLGFEERRRLSALMSCKP